MDSKRLAGNRRLSSLDALRGFDMFWIIGAEGVVRALNDLSHGGFAQFLTDQLTHTLWAGFTFYDLIFPLFVFIVGVSLVFSLNRSQETHGRSKTLQKVFIRGIVLYLLGLFYYGGISQGIDGIRLMGVLQRIALCYVFAALIFCFCALKTRIIICASLLGGYWFLMTFVPVPEFGAGNYEEGKNLANYLDKQFLPFFKWDGDHDPEGLLSTLPAIATCLIGTFAGSILWNPLFPDFRRSKYLAVVGIGMLVVGYLWSLQFPIIKKIWTSSYVLVTGGYCCLLLALFYQVIELWGFRKWALPFIWIGVNPITIYLAHELLDFNGIAERLVGGPIKAGFGAYGELVVVALVLIMSIAVVRFLYHRKIFLRI